MEKRRQRGGLSFSEDQKMLVKEDKTGRRYRKENGMTSVVRKAFQFLDIYIRNGRSGKERLRRLHTMAGVKKTRPDYVN